MLTSPLVRTLIQLALQEDLAFGDVTSELLVPRTQTGSAVIVAREDLVIAGCDLVHMVNEEGRFGLTIDLHVGDGEQLKNETPIATLSGRAQALLSSERTILNFLQRMSGVATHTRSFISTVGEGITVLDTRKTLPGWRVLDKYAVRVGGASNHRLSLGDMILVKNNHIDAHPEGLHGVLKAVASRKSPYMGWEVEVRDLAELRSALPYSPTIVMLDNFTDTLVTEAVKIVRANPNPPLLEVSGGMNPERARWLKGQGVNSVSAGALTTAARNVDISLRLSINK